MSEKIILTSDYRYYDIANRIKPEFAEYLTELFNEHLGERVSKQTILFFTQSQMPSKTSISHSDEDELRFVVTTDLTDLFIKESKDLATKIVRLIIKHGETCGVISPCENEVECKEPA